MSGDGFGSELWQRALTLSLCKSDIAALILHRKKNRTCRTTQASQAHALSTADTQLSAKRDQSEKGMTVM